MFKTFTVLFLSVFVYTTSFAQSQPDSATVKNKLFLQTPNPALFRLPLVVPQGFYIKNLPFFCDKEYKLEKLTKIPFRFRLGSVEYCDKLEGKNR